MQQARHALFWQVPELRPVAQQVKPGAHVTPLHASVPPGHMVAQKPVPPRPRQQLCPRVHAGVHMGGGVALQVSPVAMHARSASQQYVPGPQRAVGQKSAPPLSLTVPPSVPPGHRPVGTQICPNIVLQHSCPAEHVLAPQRTPVPPSVPPGHRPVGTQICPSIVLQHSCPAEHVLAPQRTPVPPSVPVGQRLGATHAMNPNALQHTCAALQIIPPHVAPASVTAEHVPRCAQNSRPITEQHSCVGSQVIPPHVAPASTAIGHEPVGTHTCRPPTEQHSCVGEQVIPPHVPPPPSLTGLHGTVRARHVGPTGVAQHC
jgi:hypothetical protein